MPPQKIPQKFVFEPQKGPLGTWRPMTYDALGYSQNWTCLVLAHSGLDSAVTHTCHQLGLQQQLGCALTCSWGRAWLTRFVPGFAHIVCAAAHSLCHIKRQFVLTSGSVIASVAKAFSHVYVTEKQAHQSEQEAATNEIHVPGDTKLSWLLTPK